MTMKKIILALALCGLVFAALPAAAKKKAEITFKEMSYNFGNVRERGGEVSHEFVFENTGDANLVILDATADCGCTVPSYPKNPVAPGKKGKIKVTFNPLLRPGGFTKVVTVKSNAKNKRVRLKITGVVNPNKK